jgi:2-polyprenyl-3-methyl-5-hydroxy-6-metoxy-1,4-benzoquinol methylase
MSFDAFTDMPPGPEQSNPFAPGPVPPQTNCKCCGQPSFLVAVMDASRSGSDARAGRSVTPLSGLPIYFYSCSACDFTFTRAFDHWTSGDFAKHIYNHDYPQHDPQYADGARGTRTAMDLIGQFGTTLNALSVLDWGGGEGSFAATLRQHGLQAVTSYDPFVESASARPAGQFDIVTCFEVMEHSTDPAALVCELANHRAADGVILISTLCCTRQTIEFGLHNWHYAVPRNGHISFMTPKALQHCARKVGLVAHSFTNSAHTIFDAAAVPPWLAPFLRG